MLSSNKKLTQPWVKSELFSVDFGDRRLNERFWFLSEELAKHPFYKQDGSQQCGTGKKLDSSVMQKDLGSIEVFSAENKHDGMMRIQMCGHPTGNCNVFEIPPADLDKALKLGFKKWLRD